MDIYDSGSRVESVSRFQSLQAGQYWRALADIPDQGICASEVLLIQSIRWVDDAPHTIILRPHPSKIGTSTYLALRTEDGKERRTYFKYDEHRFLLKDFLTFFDVEIDHQRIRNEELLQIQAKVNAIQTELLEAQSNSSILAKVVGDHLLQKSKDSDTSSPDAEPTSYGSCLPALPVENLASIAFGTVSDAIGTGITEARIAQLKTAAGHQHEVATIKAKWIQGKTAEIASTIKAMTPFYEEQAAAALALTEDVRTYVSKLIQGIASLDLYVGKDVVVEAIREGQGASKDVPPNILPKKAFDG